MLANPARVVGAAVVTILLFALAYPFAGTFAESVVATGAVVTYSLDLSNPPETAYAVVVFKKSLQLSLQAFTLAGSTGIEPHGLARYLAYVESLLGMGFVAALAASLVREE